MKLAMLCLVTLIAAPSFAAIPKKKKAIQIEKLFEEGAAEKFSGIKSIGKNTYKKLVVTAFDNQEDLKRRWSAFMALVKIGGKESSQEINRAIKSPEWFMRDAALKVLPLVDPKKAGTVAIKMLSDPSLIVRTSAADALKVLNAPGASEPLWQALYDKRNYMRGQSLWVRRHIVEALAEVSGPGNDDRFLRVLDDQDKTLAEPAVKGLERSTGKNLGDPLFPTHYRVQLWKEWNTKRVTKNN